MNVKPLSRIGPIKGIHDEGHKRLFTSQNEVEGPLRPSSEGGELLEENHFSKQLASVRLWANQREKFLASLLTLEEKIGQLILFELDPQYDFDQFQTLKSMVLESQIGGILFNKGNLRRECYLIEHMQALSSIPLLIGHSLQQGFSYLFSSKDQDFGFSNGKEIQYFEDLGKMIMIQNRRLGVHFQCFQIQNNDPIFTSAQQKAFRRGLRAIRGLSAYFQKDESSEKGSFFQNPLFALPSNENTLIYKKDLMLSSLSSKTTQKELIEVFSTPFDMLHIQDDPEELIGMIVDLVDAKAIDESLIDRKLKNLLLIKSVFFTKKT